MQRRLPSFSIAASFLGLGREMYALGNIPRSSVANLRTPSYVVDLKVAKKNCERMIDAAKEMNLHLRPHVKTHKTEELALLQTGGRRQGITVSTMAEAEWFADRGFDDILYAVPITPDKLPAAAALTARLQRFTISIDSAQQADALIAYGPPSKDVEARSWSVNLMVDCGYHREGLDPECPSSIKLAKRLFSVSCITLNGVYTHGGHSYDALDSHAVQEITRQERNAVVAMAEALEQVGLECREIGIGSTPTCASLLKESIVSPDTGLDEYRNEIGKGLTELHPGNYVFFDTAQLKIGSCASTDDIAVRVLTRIVGHYRSSNTMLVDMGWTAQGGGQGFSDDFGCFTHRWTVGKQGKMTMDTAPASRLKVMALKQEVGEVSTRDGSPIDWEMYPIGTIMSFAPYHSCATGHNFPSLKVIEGEEVVSEFAVSKGW